MASDHRRHFSDPHILLKMSYNNTATHICDICDSKLAGLTGYRCSACHFDIHEACADYFNETIVFLSHPHPLTLTRMPNPCKEWCCDICRQGCCPGTLVYHCNDCPFEVHPICTMLPKTFRSDRHPKHDLHLVPSQGTCDGCGCKQLPVWNYACSCPFRLHIACVSNCGQSNTNTSTATDTPRSSGQNQTSTTTATGRRQSSSRSVALFLIKAGVTAAINVATHGLASPVLEALRDAYGD